VREAFNKGVAAYHNGAGFGDCPYPAWSDEKGEWIAGWRSAAGQPTW
jgi:ribosome modulation factor